jgi:hypothetical protein
MSDEAAKHIGNGLCWLGFWIFACFAFCDLDVSISYKNPKEEYLAAKEIGTAIKEKLK